jgi:hypothetical protein
MSGGGPFYANLHSISSYLRKLFAFKPAQSRHFAAGLEISDMLLMRLAIPDKESKKVTAKL